MVLQYNHWCDQKTHYIEYITVMDMTNKSDLHKTKYIRSNLCKPKWYSNLYPDDLNAYPHI